MEVSRKRKERSNEELNDEFERLRAVYSNLERLPGDIIMTILTESGLSIRDILRLCQINKHWRNICKNRNVWDAAFEKNLVQRIQKMPEEKKQSRREKWEREKQTMPNGPLRLWVFGLTWHYSEQRPIVFTHELIHPLYWRLNIGKSRISLSIGKLSPGGGERAVGLHELSDEQLPPYVKKVVDHFHLKRRELTPSDHYYTIRSQSSWRHVIYYLFQQPDDWTFYYYGVSGFVITCNICAQHPTITCGCSCEKEYCSTQCLEKDHKK